MHTAVSTNMLPLSLPRMNKHVVLFFPAFSVPLGFNHFPPEDSRKEMLVHGPWSMVKQFLTLEPEVSQS